VEQSVLRDLTAEVVASYVANNSVSFGDVPVVIHKVHASLSALGKLAEVPEKKTPIVSARASVKPDYLVCMECGRKQKMLRRHLQTAHGLTPEQYRKDYGLPDSYPMTAPNYSEVRRRLAKASGLGRRKRS
jgi:predicted transcriptional regulator